MQFGSETENVCAQTDFWTALPQKSHLESLTMKTKNPSLMDQIHIQTDVDPDRCGSENKP